MEDSVSDNSSTPVAEASCSKPGSLIFGLAVFLAVIHFLAFVFFAFSVCMCNNFYGLSVNQFLDILEVLSVFILFVSLLALPFYWKNVRWRRWLFRFVLYGVFSGFILFTMPRAHDQTRPRCAKAKFYIRKIKTALESYAIDHEGEYPPSTLNPSEQVVPFYKDGKIPTFKQGEAEGELSLDMLKYLPDGLPLDPFSRRGEDGSRTYAYWSMEKDGRHTRYFLWSRGPDQDFDLTPEFLEAIGSSDSNSLSPEARRRMWSTYQYDPTNGSRSSGDIW